MDLEAMYEVMDILDELYTTYSSKSKKKVVGYLIETLEKEIQKEKEWVNDSDTKQPSNC